MARKLPNAVAGIPNVDLLSETELEALRKEAEGMALDEQKKKARTAALEAFRRQAASSVDPDEELIDFQVDLPGYADRLTIDGTVYMHGVVYKLARRQYESVREIVQNAWRHERIIGGANANEYRRPSNPTLNAGGGGSYLRA